MFEPIVDEHERGQVGIGTLIVFIAMVLVAAIAAGVLINTAGVLQTQASDTGSETQEAVANQIEVTHAAGQVSGDVVDQVDMTLMKSAGSNAIDLEAMTVQYTSDSTDQTLTWTDSGGATDESFVTEPLTSGTDGSSLTTTDDRVKLSINTAALEPGNNLGVQVNNQIEDDTGNYDISIDSSVDDSNTATFVATVDSSSGTEDTINLALSGDVGSDSGSATIPANGEGTITLTASGVSEGDSFTITGDGGSENIVTEHQGEIVSTGGLEAGSSATVSLVDQSGAEYTYGISVPSTFGNKQVVEV